MMVLVRQGSLLILLRVALVGAVARDDPDCSCSGGPPGIVCGTKSSTSNTEALGE